MTNLSHLDNQGHARMVNVAAKPVTARRAVAQGRVRISNQLADAIQADTLKKGNLLTVAEIAGVQAAKRTDQLIPLCHSLPLDHIHVTAQLDRPFIHITAEATTTARTGVEMEALTAVAVAALTVIDMGKAIDKTMTIESIRLLEKTGGKSGPYHADTHSRDATRRR